jgi:hypothetical protein
MRTWTLLAVMSIALGCSQPMEPPGPSEFVQFRYTLAPGGIGTYSKLVLPLLPNEPGMMAQGLICDKPRGSIEVNAQKGRATARIRLFKLMGRRDPASGQDVYDPFDVVASTVTSGRANVDITVPLSPDMGTQAFSFSTDDAGDLFTCRLHVDGPDPFTSLHGTLTCDSKPIEGRQLALIDGEFRAGPCPPSP